MRFSYRLSSIDKYQLLAWADAFNIFFLLDSHKEDDPLYNASFDYRLAVDAIRTLELPTEGAFELLSEFLSDGKNDWVFGGLSYDLKNDLEALSSENTDRHGLADMLFFVPKYLFEFKDGILELFSTVKVDVEELEHAIRSQVIPEDNLEAVKVQSSLNKSEYVNKIKLVQEKIQSGDIYEMNFCQNFFAEDVQLSPTKFFQKLNENSRAPFSTLFRFNSFYLISASPERYVKKQGSTIISQPIKGTRKRGKNDVEDFQLKEELSKSQKDQIENVMIVDLVRNDLSRIAAKSSVKVTDLFGVYSFPHVHQMISTICCELASDKNYLDVITSSFPMGSMTGAPKIRAMELIEEFEDFKRSYYSGSVGYFTPNRDFDFNVVIRSVLYQDDLKYLSFPVGGAITIDSSPMGEYEECLVKIQGVLKALNTEKFNMF